MRLLFVADGRSPIAMNWIRYFILQDHEVHLASTFPCEIEKGLASFTLVPVAFSGVKSNQLIAGKGKAGVSRKNSFLWGAALVNARTRFRQWLGPLTLPGSARRLRAIIDRVQPDVVHAMRIPYEGMLVAFAKPTAPLLISVWGNDFTLHALSTPWMGALTRRAVRFASGLHTDCQRDVRLAQDWGFPANHPCIVLPGAGGVQEDLFFPAAKRSPLPMVINPRGVRTYVRNDTFFRAAPEVIDKVPEARFVCPGMAEEVRARRWVAELKIGSNVDLLPQVSRGQMAELFRLAWVTVSPTTHDGTPNTLLEAMACGCFPIAGDLESIREWITPGENGILIDPTDPISLSRAILKALNDPALRRQAAEQNTQLIARRAAYSQVMTQAERFYERLAGLKTPSEA